MQRKKDTAEKVRDLSQAIREQNLAARASSPARQPRTSPQQEAKKPSTRERAFEYARCASGLRYQEHVRAVLHSEELLGETHKSGPIFPKPCQKHSTMPNRKTGSQHKRIAVHAPGTFPEPHRRAKGGEAVERALGCATWAL